MEDGLCDRGVVYSDIATIHARDLGKPVGYLAGFPCQAGVRIQLGPTLSKRPGQGVSRAGDGRGLLDGRSNLVSHLFRLHDEA